MVDIRDRLEVLHADLLMTLKFEALEDQLYMKFQGNGKGNITLSGYAMDKTGIGNKLSFSLEIDQTQLKQGIDQLNRVIEKYPIR